VKKHSALSRQHSAKAFTAKGREEREGLFRRRFARIIADKKYVAANCRE